MASPKPPAPSSRVVVAFFVAAIIGGLMFLIWWVTGRQAAAPQDAADLQGRPALRTATEGPAPQPERGGVLRGTVDPEDLPETIALLTQATLVRVNRSTDQLEPWLAESWTSTNNNLTYVLKLRPNILWSDGAPLMAENVVAAISSSSDARVLGKPLTARAISATELEVTFPGSFGPGLRLLDHVRITSAHRGLGPFVEAEQPANGTRAFTRNLHYWRTAPDGKWLPYLDRVELDATPGQGAPGANLTRLLSGDLTFIQAELPPREYTALKRADQENKARLYDLGPGMITDVLWVNRSRFAKDDFRLAISAAVDRREYCDIIYLGACDPAFSPITAGNPAWFNPDLPAVGPDPALARAMLAGIGLQDRNSDGVLEDEAGHAVRLSLLIARGSASAERGAAYLRDELKKLGLAVDVTPLDATALADRQAKGNYDAIFGRVELRDSDPAMNLTLWLHPAATTDWERRINELMLKQATSTDRVARVQLFADAQKVVAQHMPEIFIAAPYTYVATGMRVRNVRPARQRPALLWNADQLALAGP